MVAPVSSPVTSQAASTTGGLLPEPRRGRDAMPPVPIALRAEAEIAARVTRGSTEGARLATSWLADHGSKDAGDFSRALVDLVPPPPDEQATRTELAFMREMVPARTDAANEIATFQARFGAHDLWNGEFDAWAKTVSPEQAQRGAALIKRADKLNMAASEVIKDKHDRKRPYEFDPTFPTIWRIGQRNAAYPSGHTSLAYSFATVLGHLNPARADYYLGLARNTAWSRVYGGVHWLSDVETGALVGTAVATAVLRDSQGDA